MSPRLAIALGFGVAVLIALSEVSVEPPRHGSAAAIVARSAGSFLQPVRETNWTTYLHDTTRSVANLAERQISAANASRIDRLWAYHTNGPTYTNPIVLGNVVYFGSWNGYEYALNASTGARLWRTYLGRTTGPINGTGCQAHGVESTATLLGRTLYLGGGDAYWYALNATSGAIEWKVFIADPSEGFYNWASPLIYGRYAYVGTASLCDDPLVNASLLKIDLRTHTIVDRFNTTLNGSRGASIWGSPAVDPASGTIFAVTGNPGSDPNSTPYAESILAFNSTSLKHPISQWQVPASQQVFDGDFGTTPDVFHVNGRGYVAAVNKDGVFYVFNASNVGAGPVWEHRLSNSYDLVPATYAGGTIFVGSQYTRMGHAHAPGGFWAFGAADGTLLWERLLPGQVVGAGAYANGVLAVGAGKTFELLAANNGTTLRYWNFSANVFSTPTIVNGRIYVTCANGNLTAFGLNSSAKPIAALEPAVASGAAGPGTSPPVARPAPVET